MFRVIAILLCAIGLSANVQADELIIHTVSIHTAHNHDSTETWQTVGSNGKLVSYTREIPGYNNLNIGFGYRWDSGWSAGLYYNSYRLPTAYVAREWMPFEHYGVFAGAATGYGEMSGHPITMIGGFISRAQLSSKSSLNILFTPPISNKTDGVMHMTVLRKF